MTVAAIVLAADSSQNGDRPPALLAWDDQTVLIEYVIAELRRGGVRDVEVVLGFAADLLLPYVTGDNVEPIINGDWRAGTASSLRVGATAVPRGTTAAVVMRVDEPRPSELISQLIERHVSTGAPITRPSHSGAPGKPVVVSGAVLAELRNVVDDAAFERLLAKYAAQSAYVACDAGITTSRVVSEEDCRRLRDAWH